MHQSEDEGLPYRNLIAAILSQAVTDASQLPTRGASYKRCSIDKRSALRFINKDNPLFIKYVELLGMLPEYAAKKMHKNIRLILRENMIRRIKYNHDKEILIRKKRKNIKNCPLLWGN